MWDWGCRRIRGLGEGGGGDPLGDWIIDGCMTKP